MKTTRLTVLAVLLTALCWATLSSLADPSLPITKPPVTALSQLTGPPIDPPAAQGQWFINPGGVQTCRSNEFYDNVAGGSGGVRAISGYVNTITYTAGAGTPILAFTILATVSNDTSSTPSDWAFGDNSHGETNLYQAEAYQGPLVDTKLTADFAITDPVNLPTSFTDPYFDFFPYIEAVNEDQAAWYCWNPEDDAPEHNGVVGWYYVPTWDFGTIPEGQWVTRELSFVIAAPGLQPADSRYTVLVISEEGKMDILLNRSTSLKISTWIDGIDVDTGIAYPDPPKRSSDVSVFHNKWEGEPPELDYGDAPDQPYPTFLASDGARHLISSGVRMGSLIDAEADGQPNSAATGDDMMLLDDEDGVTFTTPIQMNTNATVQITNSVAGYLSAWVDFNGNGTWNDAGEQIYAVYAVTAGVNNLTFAVPNSPAGVAGGSYARFRFSTWTTPLTPKGLAPDGEVEDYAIEITEAEEQLDFGDADDSALMTVYPTLLANNGARHTYVPGVYMGTLIDTEADGLPSFSADGDNLNNLDDEDGVVIPAVLYAGSTTQVVVTASVFGFLDAWIDWNANSSWAEPGEQVFTQQALVPGANVLPLNVPMPPALVAGGPHSRWRFSSAPTTPSFFGAYVDGEVEDYEVHLQTIDLGDAPAPYPSLLSANGARHDTLITPTVYLGAVPPDIEPDGLPEADALGDDLDNTDDEDGVVQSGSLILGSNGTLNVTASASSILNAWIDFNQDGDWADSGEQIATDSMMIGGGNSLTVPVPLGATPGQTFARFRLSSASGLSYTGAASDGEVEDYSFILYQDGPTNTTNLVFTNIVRATTNEAQVWWVAETSVVYQVQFTTNLVDPPPVPWTDVGGTVIGPTNDQTDSNAVDRMHFYRIVVPYVAP